MVTYIIVPFSVIFEKSYHNDQTKVCFSNCVYDIQRNRAYAFDRKHITDYSLPYEWRADATCPRWEQFLAEVLPDPSERSCLQEFFGMCYIDRERLSIEKMALLIGEGSNGKSVIFDVMKNVIKSSNLCKTKPPESSLIPRAECLCLLCFSACNQLDQMQ